MRNNPLLRPSKLRYGAPLFDKIREDDYLPAFRKAIEQAYKDVDAITSNPEPPTFENTIEALEFSGKLLDEVSGIFFNLNECLSSDKMQGIAEEISPELTRLSLYTLFNDKLFARIKAVYDQRKKLHLDKEQARLLEKRFRAFKENGALLDEEGKKHLAKNSEEASLLTLKFGKNVLDATNDFILYLTDKEDVAELPDYVLEAAEEEANSRKLKGWVFTLQAPSYSGFMKFSPKRELRKKMYLAYGSRCLGGKYDNTAIIKRILELRMDSSNLLGFKTPAQGALKYRMAKNPKTVNSFLKDLLDKTLPYAKQDVKRIEDFARKHGFKDKLQGWDFAYWSEKLRKSRYSLSDDQVKPFFRLENVQRSLFDLARKLYGIRFVEAKDIPVYHKDVKVYDVLDKDGSHLALFYSDFYPRKSKRGGAWMTSFRDSGGIPEQRPLISIVCNFTKPTPTKPSLLTFGEVTTILHEFGHALHGILGKGKYPSLTGTSVTRDFVELPSQIMENWAVEEEFLKMAGRHYKTNKVIGKDLISKIKRARNYNSGYAFVRQLAFGITDMALHTMPKEKIAGINSPEDLENLENRLKKKCHLMPVVKGCAFCPSFTHIFSGGYAAGYYSYKWAEVLEADAFSLFKKNGIFDKKTARSFRENILEKGNLEDAAVLYRNFRGRDPRPEALLRRDGLTRPLRK
ncbi:MAG: M3 family metallopeptidase [Bacteroidales bacterium]|nr:M3 family metallopeptidase [Bacteroidales bacterium]